LVCLIFMVAVVALDVPSAALELASVCLFVSNVLWRCYGERGGRRSRGV
jgi:hypothetical protein